MCFRFSYRAELWELETETHIYFIIWPYRETEWRVNLLRSVDYENYVYRVACLEHEFISGFESKPQGFIQITVTLASPSGGDFSKSRWRKKLFFRWIIIIDRYFTGQCSSYRRNRYWGLFECLLSCYFTFLSF
jgi:hypothetical protein